MKNTRDIVLSSRNDAILSIAYNINRMGFLPKLEENGNIRTDNILRIIAHILRNNFKEGIYVSEKFIKENNFNIKEDKKHPVLIEYLKETDEETGGKSYRYLKKYNIEQLVEFEKAKKLFEFNKKQVEIKKYNLRKENFEKFFKEKEFDLLNKMFFIGIIRLITGKEIEFKYRYTKDVKDTLIESAKEMPEFIRNEFKKTYKNVIEYLQENELVKKGDE